MKVDFPTGIETLSKDEIVELAKINKFKYDSIDDKNSLLSRIKNYTGKSINGIYNAREIEGLGFFFNLPKENLGSLFCVDGEYLCISVKYPEITSDLNYKYEGKDRNELLKIKKKWPSLIFSQTSNLLRLIYGNSPRNLYSVVECVEFTERKIKTREVNLPNVSNYSFYPKSDKNLTEAINSFFNDTIDGRIDSAYFSSYHSRCEKVHNYGYRHRPNRCHHKNFVWGDVCYCGHSKADFKNFCKNCRYIVVEKTEEIFKRYFEDKHKNKSMCLCCISKYSDIGKVCSCRCGCSCCLNKCKCYCEHFSNILEKHKHYLENVVSLTSSRNSTKDFLRRDRYRGMFGPNIDGIVVITDKTVIDDLGLPRDLSFTGNYSIKSGSIVVGAAKIKRSNGDVLIKVNNRLISTHITKLRLF